MPEPDAAPTDAPETDAAEPTPEPAGRRKRREKQQPQGLWRGWIRPLGTVIIIVTALRSSLLDWNDVPTGSMIPTVAIGDRIVVNKLSYGFNPPFNGPVIAIPFTKISFTNPADFLPGVYWGGPKRNDIVTFWKPSMWDQHHATALQGGLTAAKANAYADEKDDGGIRMVKRIVAIPGDVVTMRRVVEKFDGRTFELSKLTINGEEATYTDKKGIELTETLLGESRRIQYARYTDVLTSDGRLVKLNPRPQSLDFGPVTLGKDQYLMIGDNRDNSQDGRFFGTVDLKQITGKAKFVAVSFHEGAPAWSRFFMGFDKNLAPGQ